MTEQKAEQVKFLKEAFQKANGVLLADYKGVTSNEMNNLRTQLRGDDVKFLIVKNNLVRVALKDTPKAAAVENLVGPTAILFSYGDVAAKAKILKTFSKTVEALSLKDGFLEDRVIQVAEIEQLADLPPRDVLIAQLLGVLNGPIRSFCGVLNGVQRDFVCVLKAIADKKES